MTSSLSPHDALVAVMMVVSAADREVSDKELQRIIVVVQTMPAFERFDRDRIERVVETIADLMQSEDGLDALMGLIVEALPFTMRETAYAFACDVAAADGVLAVEEMRLLEIIRHKLEIGRLAAAAIERGARARHQRVPEDD